MLWKWQSCLVLFTWCHRLYSPKMAMVVTLVLLTLQRLTKQISLPRTLVGSCDSSNGKDNREDDM